MERFWNSTENPGQLRPLSLAFLGDCVFELLVREQLVCGGSRSSKSLHEESVRRVCCSAQAQAAKRLAPVLTPEEAAVFNRGRNAHVGHVPKSASVADYHAATGLEALFGYLYLMGNQARLRELFSMLTEQEAQK